MTIALVPGSFDPVTYGHLDIICKSSRLFDRVIVLVADNIEKTPMFSASERVGLIEAALDELREPEERVTNVEVHSFKGLLAAYAKEVGASCIIKGIRSGDYDSELGMALLNRQLSGVETLFLPATTKYAYIASSYVKDVAIHGGNISPMVPAVVASAISDKISTPSRHPAGPSERSERGASQDPKNTVSE